MKKKRIQLSLLVLLVTALIVSCLHPIYPREMYLQHSATIVLIGFLVYVRMKNRISSLSFFLVSLLTLLHIIGARWIYSYTPYDQWIRSVFGFSIDNLVHSHRNNYDRFVHFMYGLLIVIPLAEIYKNWFKAPAKLIHHAALLFILSTSMLYEVFEWLLSVFLSPEQADAYNGQQGDIWDPQKDMALAMLGALLMILFLKITSKNNDRIPFADLAD
jgi:putative membrane protein